MSAYTEQQTQFKDSALLVQALKACGVSEVNVFETAQRLEGYHGDKRADTAEIIIPRHAVGYLSNEIGFKRQPDGTYKAIVSEFDSTKYNSDWMRTLVNTYSELGVISKAKKAGLKFAGQKQVNGKLRLQFVKA